MRRFAPLVPIVIALSVPFVPVRGVAPVSSLPVASTLDEPKEPVKEKILIFRNANIYTATADKPVEGGYMVVRGGKIQAVVPAGPLAPRAV